MSKQSILPELKTKNHPLRSRFSEASNLKLKTKLNKISKAQWFTILALGFLVGVGLGRWIDLGWPVVVAGLIALLAVGLFFGGEGRFSLLVVSCQLSVVGLVYSRWLGDGAIFVLPPDSWLLSTMETFRAAFQSSLLRAMSNEQLAKLAAGLLVGSSGSFRLPANLYQNFINTGTIHIVAVSGFNVTLVISLFYDYLRWLGKRPTFILATIAIILFIFITGGQPSVVRAGIMGWLFLLGRQFGRPGHQLNILLLAAVAMVGFEPAILIKDIGFQLSFLSLLGLIYLSPLIELFLEKFLRRRTRRYWIPSWLILTASATLGAQLMTAPLIAYYFGRLSIISLLPNLLILPILLAPMLLTAAVGLVGMIWLSGAKLTALFLTPFLSYIINIADFFGGWRWASADVGRLGWWWLAIAYAIMAAGVWIIKVKSKNEKVKILTFALWFCLFTFAF